MNPHTMDILLIEKSPDLANLILSELQGFRVIVHWVESLEVAEIVLKKVPIQLVLMGEAFHGHDPFQSHSVHHYRSEDILNKNILSFIQSFIQKIEEGHR